MALVKEKIYTIDDIYNLPEGKRAELIDGQLYYMAPSSTKHQRTTGKVLDNDYTTSTTSGYKFTNMTKAETYVDDGDSGGIVYTYFDS